MTTKVIFSKHNIEFAKELREKVNAYFKENNISKYGNSSLVFKTFVMLAVYLVPFALMLSGLFDSVLLMFVCWLIMGFGMSGLGMGLMHDANHRSYSSKMWVNKLLSYSAYLLGAYPKNWQFQHNHLHHGYTNIDDHDEDIAPPGFLRFSPNKPLWKIHKYQHIYAWFFYGLMTLSWVTAKDFKRINKYKHIDETLKGPGKFNKAIRDLITSKVIYFAIVLVLPLIYTGFSWYWIVLGFVAMHFLCGFLLGIVFQTAHVMPDSKFPVPNKDGEMANHWAAHQLLTTSDYSPKSRLFSWLIGGLNYQIEHHLFPNISHVHYRKISKLVKEVSAKYELPYMVQPNFFAALVNHGRMLKMLGN